MHGVCPGFATLSSRVGLPPGATRPGMRTSTRIRSSVQGTGPVEEAVGRAWVVAVVRAVVVAGGGVGTPASEGTTCSRAGGAVGGRAGGAAAPGEHGPGVPPGAT